MQALTQEGQNAIQAIASRYNLSVNAVTSMLQAVVNGGGTMAQFSIPELGGSGQWMQGGMTMVGDMFNYNLQGTVSNLCGELSRLITMPNIFEAPKPNAGGSGNYGNWWPSEFGMPNSSGAQNNVRYAYFGQMRRLVIDYMGDISVYDTLDHQISGVSQQQGGGSSVQFSSQYGTVDTINLPLISGSTPQAIVQNEPLPNVAKPSQPVQQQGNMGSTQLGNTAQIYEAIELLANLHAKGILNDQEFNNKKAELLSRL